MKAEISYTGKLSVIAENETEVYALKHWIKNSVDETSSNYFVRVEKFDVTDNFIDPENKGDNDSLLKHILGGNK